MKCIKQPQQYGKEWSLSGTLSHSLKPWLRPAPSQPTQTNKVSHTGVEDNPRHMQHAQLQLHF